MVSAPAKVDPALLLPTEVEVGQALDRFSAAAKRRYGARLKGIFLFGSRARGDHEPDSDADVAVILPDDGWRFWDEKMQLVDLAFDHTRSSGVYVQPWPFTESEWIGEANTELSAVAASARREARSIKVVS